MKSEILNKFCNPNGHSEYMEKPFINGDYVLGTDSHIAGYIKKELIEDVDCLETYEKDYMGALEKAKGSNVYNVTIKIDNLIKAIKSVEYDNNDEHLCPDCKGKGVVDFEYTSVDDYSYTTEDTCPVCNGEGINKNYEYMALISGWFDKKNNVIDIQGCWFNPCYLEKLLFMMHDCNVTTCTFVRGEPNKGGHFHIIDGVDVVIMPVFHSDDISNIIKLECENEKKEVLRIC